MNLKPSTTSPLSAKTNQPTACIIGAPLAFGQGLDGVENAPNALRDAGLHSIIKQQGWAVEDLGDLSFQHLNGKDKAVLLPSGHTVRHPMAVGMACEMLYTKTKSAYQQEKFCLTLGGDHSISMGSIAGIVSCQPRLGLIWVDAHGDFNTPASSPTGNMHGMPLASLVGLTQDFKIPGFDWMKNFINPEQIVLVGTRSLDQEEKDLLKKTGVTVFTMTDIDRWGIGRVMEKALDNLQKKGCNPLHLSLDIDALDPYLAPSTGTRVRGGISYREAHYIAESVAETNLLRSMDLVEINPNIVSGLIDPLIEGSATDRMVNYTVSLGVELVASAFGKRIF